MPKPEPPIVMTTNVSISGFRDRSCNEQRVDAAINLVKLASKASIDCVCFPAGYLIAERTLGIPRLVKPVFDQALQSKVSFVIGVDIQEILHPRFTSADSPAMRRAINENRVPCFLAVFSAEQSTFEIVRQRSCSSSQSIPDQTINETRFMPLGTSGFQIVLCGEVYDRRVFTDDRPRAAFIAGHTTMPRLTRTMRSRSNQGVSLIASEHRRSKGGMLFCFDRGEDYSVYGRPVRGIENVGDKEFWIEAALWELTDKGFRAAWSRPSSLL